MRHRFQIEVEEARALRRRAALASYSRAYRAKLVREGRPEPRDVQARLFGLLTRSTGWGALSEQLVRLLAEDGYEPSASRKVISRMLNVDTSLQSD